MAIVSAPGKILWIGGYSVLERPNISFVTGVDKRVFASAESTMDVQLEIDCPQFNAHWKGGFGGANAVPAEVKFVHTAATVTVRYLMEKGIAVRGVRVRTFSDPAFGSGGGKSGLGSSAAVTVATVGAVLEAHGKPVADNIHLIHKIAQYVHSTVQGKVGSGFDVAASCFGGHAYTRYSPDIIKAVGENPDSKVLALLFEGEWDYVASPLELPYGFLAAFGNFGGESTSTSVMVKKVSEWKARHAEEYKVLMQKLDSANREAVDALVRINELAKKSGSTYENTLQSNGKQRDFVAFKRAFVRGRVLTKKLGVSAGVEIESDVCTELIEATEKQGAFAVKLPGAGGGDAIAALCLSPVSKRATEEFWKGSSWKKVEPVQLGISNEGVRRESRGKWESLEGKVR